MVSIKDMGEYTPIEQTKEPLFTPDIVLSKSGNNITMDHQVDEALAFLISDMIARNAKEGIIKAPEQCKLNCAARDYRAFMGAPIEVSYHSRDGVCRAYDIHFNNDDLRRVILDIQTHPQRYEQFGGIGLYSTFIHFDSRTSLGNHPIYGKYFAYWNNSDFPIAVYTPGKDDTEATDEQIKQLPWWIYVIGGVGSILLLKKFRWL